MTGVSRHTVCWLICHGQTAWNREHRYLSRTDLPLTAFGLRRAGAASWRLRRQPLEVVVHSDLRQTRETQVGLSTEREPAPMVEADPRWRESNYGRWEGLTYRELMDRFPSEAAARFADPWAIAPAGGESLAEVEQRVLQAWRALLERHDGGRIAVVSHPTPIQLMLSALLGVPKRQFWQLRIDLGALSCVDLYPTAAIVRMVNELPHLRFDEGPMTNDERL